MAAATRATSRAAAAAEAVSVRLIAVVLCKFGVIDGAVLLFFLNNRDGTDAILTPPSVIIVLCDDSNDSQSTISLEAAE